VRFPTPPEARPTSARERPAEPEEPRERGGHRGDGAGEFQPFFSAARFRARYTRSAALRSGDDTTEVGMNNARSSKKLTLSKETLKSIRCKTGIKAGTLPTEEPGCKTTTRCQTRAPACL
jgi:hypothetical protein